MFTLYVLPFGRKSNVFIEKQAESWHDLVHRQAHKLRQRSPQCKQVQSHLTYLSYHKSSLAWLQEVGRWQLWGLSDLKALIKRSCLFGPLLFLPSMEAFEQGIGLNLFFDDWLFPQRFLPLTQKQEPLNIAPCILYHIWNISSRSDIQNEHSLLRQHISIKRLPSMGTHTRHYKVQFVKYSLEATVPAFQRHTLDTQWEKILHLMLPGWSQCYFKPSPFYAALIHISFSATRKITCNFIRHYNERVQIKSYPWSKWTNHIKNFQSGGSSSRI